MERVFALRETLGNTAGIDPLQDRFHAGYIQACQDFVATDFEEAQND